MSQNNIPSLRLPTSDFDQMRHMKNMRLIGILRSAVLAPDRMMRFSPRPPVDHDSYLVRHEETCISITLCQSGKAIFRCVFLPTEDDY